VKRRLKRVVALVIVSCGLSAALTGCGSKPTYTSGGRSASYWVDVLKQPDVEMRRKAAVKVGALMEIDPAALPATIGALKDEDVKVRLAAIRSLRLYAVKKASEAVPALRDVQANDKDPQVRDAAAKAADALAAQ
jgi:HEAT repeat protein